MKESDNKFVLCRQQTNFNKTICCHCLCGCEQEAVLKATAVRSPLLVMLLILPCPPCLAQVICTPQGQGGPGRGEEGLWEGEGVLRGEGAGDISSTLPYTALPHGASP